MQSTGFLDPANHFSIGTIIPQQFDDFLLQQMQQQIDFYFSDSNLIRDDYLRSLLLQNYGAVPIHVICNFPMVKRIFASALWGPQVAWQSPPHGLPPADPLLLRTAVLLRSQTVGVSKDGHFFIHPSYHPAMNQRFDTNGATSSAIPDSPSNGGDGSPVFGEKKNDECEVDEVTVSPTVSPTSFATTSTAVPAEEPSDHHTTDTNDSSRCASVMISGVPEDMNSQRLYQWLLDKRRKNNNQNRRNFGVRPFDLKKNGIGAWRLWFNTTHEAQQAFHVLSKRRMYGQLLSVLLCPPQEHPIPMQSFPVVPPAMYPIASWPSTPPQHIPPTEPFKVPFPQSPTLMYAPAFYYSYPVMAPQTGMVALPSSYMPVTQHYHHHPHPSLPGSGLEQGAPVVQTGQVSSTSELPTVITTTFAPPPKAVTPPPASLEPSQLDDCNEREELSPSCSNKSEDEETDVQILEQANGLEENESSPGSEKENSTPEIEASKEEARDALPENPRQDDEPEKDAIAAAVPSSKEMSDKSFGNNSSTRDGNHRNWHRRGHRNWHRNGVSKRDGGTPDSTQDSVTPSTPQVSTPLVSNTRFRRPRKKNHEVLRKESFPPLQKEDSEKKEGSGDRLPEQKHMSKANYAKALLTKPKKKVVEAAPQEVKTIEDNLRALTIQVHDHDDDLDKWMP